MRLGASFTLIPAADTSAEVPTFLQTTEKNFHNTPGRLVQIVIKRLLSINQFLFCKALKHVYRRLKAPVRDSSEF